MRLTGSQVFLAHAAEVCRLGLAPEVMESNLTHQSLVRNTDVSSALLTTSTVSIVSLDLADDERKPSVLPSDNLLRNGNGYQGAQGVASDVAEFHKGVYRPLQGR